jgi:hypothetical protein
VTTKDPLVRVRQTHDYWTALSALGRAAIDYAAEIAATDAAGIRPGSDAVIERLQDLAHLAIAFAMQGAIDLGHDATKLRELERELIAELTESAHATS